MKKTLVSQIMVLSGVLFFSSCQHEVDYYQGPTESESAEKPAASKEDLSGFEYSAQFENFSYYQAKITSAEERGRFYSVFTEYPYNEEKQLTVMPILCGLTPIEAQIAVPQYVKTLYVINDEGIKEYPVGDLSITDEQTRSSEPATLEELEKVRKMVYNEILPEQSFNIKGEDLYKSTDLVIEDLKDNEEAHVWMTYLGDGNGGIYGRFWYYTYEDTDNLTIDECTFYGIKSGKQQVISFEDIQRKWYPFMTTGSKVNEEVELNIKLKNGQRMGFVYVGNSGIRFSTPALNTAENTGINYIGAEITYSSAEQSFKIEKNVTAGAIMHFTCDEKEYNVIGMENRLPGEKDSNNKNAYDGDYNDILILARFNPETIKPENELPKPELTFTTSRTGVWIFEDTYPNQGDFDFNDVVLFYQIDVCGGMMEVTCWLAAKGCDFSNTVGLMVLKNTNGDAWKNPVSKEVLWTGVKGYYNVDSNPVNLSGLPCKKVRFPCKDFQLLRPYLDNGKGACTFEHYNSTNYPYALDIPSYYDKYAVCNTWFRWPLEGHSLDAAYHFTDRKDPNINLGTNWYLNGKIKDKTQVVNRQEDQTHSTITGKTE